MALEVRSAEVVAKPEEVVAFRTAQAHMTADLTAVGVEMPAREAEEAEADQVLLAVGAMVLPAVPQWDHEKQYRDGRSRATRISTRCRVVEVAS